MTIDIGKLFVSSKLNLLQRIRRLVGCPAVAQDIVHDSFEILFAAAERQSISQPLGFVYRTARNLALDHLKHERVVARHAAAVLDTEQHDACTPDRILLARQRVAAIQRSLAALPPPTEEIFLRVKLDGWTYQQAADRFGLTPRQVERHLIKALLACRKSIQDDTAP